MISDNLRHHVVHLKCAPPPYRLLSECRFAYYFIFCCYTICFVRFICFNNFISRNMIMERKKNGQSIYYSIFYETCTSIKILNRCYKFQFSFLCSHKMQNMHSHGLNRIRNGKIANILSQLNFLIFFLCVCLFLSLQPSDFFFLLDIKLIEIKMEKK